MVLDLTRLHLHATDSSGNRYLAGSAVIDPLTQGKTGFVVKLNPQSGQYIYQSILNGQVNQVVNAIAADAAGNAYGRSRKDRRRGWPDSYALQSG